MQSGAARIFQSIEATGVLYTCLLETLSGSSGALKFANLVDRLSNEYPQMPRAKQERGSPRNLP